MHSPKCEGLPVCIRVYPCVFSSVCISVCIFRHRVYFRVYPCVFLAHRVHFRVYFSPCVFSPCVFSFCAVELDAPERQKYTRKA